MRHVFLTLPFVALFPVMASAQCPAAPDHSAAFATLVEQAQSAPSEAAAAPISDKMWELWADAPDEPAQAVLDRGMKKRASYDFAGAISDFDTLVDYCPDYAEGYNQRAFAYFLQGQWDPAVADLKRALDLSPDHIAARAGLALTYLQMGRLDEARGELLTALDMNPWLGERHLMAAGGPLAPKGQDI